MFGEGLYWWRWGSSDARREDVDGVEFAVEAVSLIGLGLLGTVDDAGSLRPVISASFWRPVSTDSLV